MVVVFIVQSFPQNYEKEWVPSMGGVQNFLILSKKS